MKQKVAHTPTPPQHLAGRNRQDSEATAEANRPQQHPRQHPGGVFCIRENIHNEYNTR